MASISFANPSYLWTLILVPLLLVTHLFSLQRAKVAALKFANFEAIEKVSKGGFFAVPYQGFMINKNFLLLITRMITYSLLIFAAAGTTINYIAPALNFDSVLAIDASSSMLSDDIKPSRLEAARNATSEFVENIKNSKIGIVSFSGTAFVEQKITDDKDKLRDSIYLLDIKESSGTNLGDAIITSANLFDAGNRSKVVVLLTDGQSNVGTPVDVAINYAKDNKIIVDTIAFGTSNGTNSIFPGIAFTVDEESLRVISNSTGGKFFKAETEEQLRAAYSEVLALTEDKVTRNISWLLLFAALVLLSVELLLVNIVYKTVP